MHLHEETAIRRDATRGRQILLNISDPRKWREEDDADADVARAHALPGFVSVTKIWNDEEERWVVTIVTESN